MEDPIARIFGQTPQAKQAPIANPTPFTISRSDTVRIDKNSRTDLLEKYPLSWIVQHRYSQSDIASIQNSLGARGWTEKAQKDSEITEMGYAIGARRLGMAVQRQLGEAVRAGKMSLEERNYALASTTPVLGQYAPTYGWPDDWGWYWEYLDAYLFVPEVEFAVNLKNRQIWKPGFHFNASSESQIKKVQNEWDVQKVGPALWDGTWTALVEGNAYLASQDDSDAKFQDSNPGDSAQGAAYTNITGAPRPLVKYTPPTKFEGIGLTDPRTFRIQVHPQRWDRERHQWLVEKYIQRRWAGPMAPNYALGSQTELDFHPDQIFHLAFHKIFGGIYGYSTMREVLFVLKGFLLMVQFLPQIVEHRADPLLDIAIGGEMTGPAGLKTTWLPNKEDFEIAKTRIAARMPGEDIFHDAMTKIEEIYKGRGSAERVAEYITIFKERILLGLGIPMAAATFSGGGEIKFGTLQFDIMDDETRENQTKVTELINDWVLPRLLLNLGHKQGDGPEMEVQMVPVGETAKR